MHWGTGVPENYITKTTRHLQDYFKKQEKICQGLSG
jgi:hypothetical protein